MHLCTSHFLFFVIQNQYAIKMFNYSYSDGRLRCNFTRLIITNNTDQDRHLNDNWFILLAHGNERGMQMYLMCGHSSCISELTNAVRSGSCVLYGVVEGI